MNVAIKGLYNKEDVIKIIIKIGTRRRVGYTPVVMTIINLCRRNNCLMVGGDISNSLMII